CHSATSRVACVLSFAERPPAPAGQVRAQPPLDRSLQIDELRKSAQAEIGRLRAAAGSRGEGDDVQGNHLEMVRLLLDILRGLDFEPSMRIVRIVVLALRVLKLDDVADFVKWQLARQLVNASHQRAN